jgi:catechol 2,3-dioxygenase-like lactoylglutathione lyase family enzyme
MKIGHIELFVKSVKVSKDFFCNVLDFELVIEQKEVSWVRLGGTEILLRPGSPHGVQNYHETSIGLVIYTEDLNKSASKLKNKGLVFKGTDRNKNCLTFTDPDGHWFQLVNPNEPH